MGNKKSAPQSQQFSGLVLVNNATSDSPEYRTLTQCYPTLVTCLQQSPNDIADRLRPFGIFAHEDWLFLTHESKDRDQKARRIIDVVILQVKLNPQVAHTFRLALEGAGTWTKAAVSELETTYNSFTKGTQSQPLQACSISDETQSPESIDGSICAQIHSRAFSHHSQPTSDNFQLDKDNSTDDCDTSSGLPEIPSRRSLSVRDIDTSNSSGIDVSLPLSNHFASLICECGKCTILGHIRGEDQCSGSKPARIKVWCPDPPYPENRMSRTEIPYSTFKVALREEKQKVEAEFYKLIYNTFDLLESKAKFCRVKNYVSSYVLTQGIAQTPAGKSLRAITQFEELCELLQNSYCSWFNYKLISVLRKCFLSTEQSGIDEDLLKYESLLGSLIERCSFVNIAEDDLGSHPQSGIIEICCKVDINFDKLTIKEVEALRLVLVECLEKSLTEYSLTLKSVREGCTELVFRATEYLKRITKLSPYQIYWLRKKGFLEVTIDDLKLLSKADATPRIPSHEQCQDYFLDYPSSSKISEVSESSLFQEAGGDPTNLGLTHIDSQIGVSYRTLCNICEKELELKEEMQLNVFPGSIWKATHDGQPCITVLYNGKVENKVQFSEFLNDMLDERQNIMKICCIHLDAELSDMPILLFDPEQSLVEYCTSCKTILSEIEQLTVLRDVALGTILLQSNPAINVKVPIESIFVHKDSDGEIRALFSPLYRCSCFPQNESTSKPTENYKWIKDALLLMHCRENYNENSELPESHILYNIFKYKWFSDNESLHPKEITEVAKEISYILDLEKARISLIDALTCSDVVEESHLHMILIGHTGVGKTSIRKHLQNIPFNKKEDSTVIMEQELLYQETMEALTDTSSREFSKKEKIYISEPDKVFLTLWDTGGQPMFQDLLPCFAKLRSIYGIVFRLCDLLENPKAVVRPVCPLLEHEKESTYTYMEYFYRCLAFLESSSSSLLNAFSNLPPEVRKESFNCKELHTFPRVALIGTFKDKVKEDDSQLLKMFALLKESLKPFDFISGALLPVPAESGIFEIDNTRSGQMHEDPGMRELRKQIIACIQNNKAKIPSAWISFKVDLIRESQLQQPCTGIVTLNKATELSKSHKISLIPALCYFHELGIFLWYHENEFLKDYVIIEPKNLVSILGSVLNPKVFIESRDLWQQLQAKGIIDTESMNKLFTNSKTGLPCRWILSFFEEQHLAMRLNTENTFFIPSILQDDLICPNHLHIHNLADNACKFLALKNETQVAPLFLVPKFSYIPSGFFPRLMTVLAGIQDGEIVWKLALDRKHYKRMVSFIVNDQSSIVFTEFIRCIRIQMIPHPATTIEVLRKLCQAILIQLKVQLQRVFPQASGSCVTVTFACLCSNMPHFLPTLPTTTEDKVCCREPPNFDFKLSPQHKIWLPRFIPTITTDKDADKYFEKAIKEGFVKLQMSTVLFVGVPRIKTFLAEPTTIGNSDFYVIENNSIDVLQPKHWNQFLARNAVIPIEPDTKKVEDSKDIDKEKTRSSSSENTNFKQQLNTDTDASTTQTVNYMTPTKATKGSHKSKDSNEGQKKQKTKSYIKLGKEVLDSAANSADILMLMHNEFKEESKLELIKTIESNETRTIEILSALNKEMAICIVNTIEAERHRDLKNIAHKLVRVQKENITSIREELLKELITEGSKNRSECIPYSWYYLCCSIWGLRENTNFLTLDEVLVIAEKCQVTKHELSDALTFLHKCGLLAYFKDALPNIVFQSSSVLIQILDSVHKAPHKNGAVVSEDTFRKINGIYVEGRFTHRDAIKVFQHLLIIFPLEKYFVMPSLLVEAKNEKRRYSTSPLQVIRPRRPGVFGFLLCYLTSKHNTHLWPWELHVDAKKRLACLFKNCVEFTLPGYSCIITLFESSDFIELSVEYAENRPPFAKLKSAVVDGLKAVNQSCTILESKLGFSCGCKKVDFSHTTVYDKSKQLLVCPFHPSAAAVPLSHHQKLWFEEGIAEDNDTLSVVGAFRYFFPRYKEWFQVGLELGLNTRALENISRQYRKKPDIALMETVKYWFKTTPNPSWYLIMNITWQDCLNFETGTPAPYKMSRPVDAVVHNGTAFFRRFRMTAIDMFNSQAQIWSTLPDCPVQDTSLAILPVNTVQYMLHTVGGYLQGKCFVGDLYLLGMRLKADHSGNEYYWKKSSFPAMKEPRKEITTVYVREYNCLIAAGGRGMYGPTRTVEVLNIKTKQWFTVARLPHEVFGASGCISEGYLYIAGGCIYDQASHHIENKSVFRAPLSVLRHSKEDTTESVFEHIVDLPHERSTCITFQDRVFAIGGTKRSGREALPTNRVFWYHSQEDTWKRMPNSLTTNRCYCFAVSFMHPKPRLMVVGGYTTRHNEGCTNSVEIAEVEFRRLK